MNIGVLRVSLESLFPLLLVFMIVPLFLPLAEEVEWRRGGDEVDGVQVPYPSFLRISFTSIKEKPMGPDLYN